jgi:hypothetical protein
MRSPPGIQCLNNENIPEIIPQFLLQAEGQKVGQEPENYTRDYTTVRFVYNSVHSTVICLLQALNTTYQDRINESATKYLHIRPATLHATLHVYERQSRSSSKGSQQHQGNL